MFFWRKKKKPEDELPEEQASEENVTEDAAEDAESYAEDGGDGVSAESVENGASADTDEGDATEENTEEDAFAEDADAFGTILEETTEGFDEVIAYEAESDADEASDGEEETSDDEAEEEPVKKKGFFKRLFAGMSKTRSNLADGLRSLFGGSKIDDDFYEELEEILIMADLGVTTTESILDGLRAKVKEQHIKEPAECRQLLMDTIREQMAVPEDAYEFENKPSVILMVGVNGVGKTTTAGKIAGSLLRRIPSARRLRSS